MKLSDLKFDYPEELVAVEPARPTRVMWVENQNPDEISLNHLLEKIPAGDVLVINNTKVLKRRVFAENETEVLFLDLVEQKASSNVWKVLFPSKKYKVGDVLKLPKAHAMKLVEKGRPQMVEVAPAISDEVFAEIAELPLPPYIQKARDNRHNVQTDETWYQTAWAEKAGSMAAPTASLHFTKNDINKLRERGVSVIELTLHVGPWYFLAGIG